MNESPSQIKKELMSILYNNENIVDLLDNDTVEYRDELIGINIFPFLKIDYTEQQKGTYICLGVNFPSVSDNQILKKMELTFLIISNNTHNMIQTGKNAGFSRSDLIVEEILHTFNWNGLFGFDLKLSSDIEGTVNEHFYYRELIFQANTTNSMENGIRVNQWMN